MPMPILQGLVYEKAKATELDALAQEAQFVVYSTKSIFPFALFPTKLTICPNRITITVPGLFTKDEYPIPIDFVSGARVYQSLFFATLNIEVFRYEQPPQISFLSIKDARIARRYILALIDCRKNNIDLTNHSLKELREKLNKIGKVQVRS